MVVSRLERSGAVVVGELILQHLGVVVAASGTAMVAIMSIASGGPELPAIGVGSVGAFLVAIVGVVIRSQQVQIRQQARRIAHLERELDRYISAQR